MSWCATARKLVALRSGLKAQVHGVLAKQGLLPQVSDLFGVTGAQWLRQAPLDLVYRQRVSSLLELIDAYDGEVETFRRMIAGRLAGHRGYRVIQQIGGIAPDLRRDLRRGDRRHQSFHPPGEVDLLGRAHPTPP